MEITDNISKQTKYLIYLLLAVVIYFVFFHRLDSFYMRTWDESIYAVNTYEMLQKKEFIAPYMNGVIDNDKPPMLFWHQMVAIKLFGYNELAVRFPSALYGAFTVLLLFVFTKKEFGLLLAFCAALALMCAKGFVSFHSSRTGEMDSMLAFSMFGLCLSFYKFIKEQKTIHLLFYVFFLVFGFYTKAIVIFFVLPVHAAYILIMQRNLLKDLRMWLGLIAGFGLIGLFLYVRNGYEDDYINKHFLGLFSRYNKIIIKDHIQPFDFYINNLFNERFAVFAMLIVPAIYLITKEQSKNLKLFMLLNTIAALFFLTLISVSSSKLFWYDVPLYPMFAIIVGYFIWKTVGYISINTKTTLTFILLFFIVPVYYAAKRSLNNDIGDVNMRRCEVIPEYFHDHKTNMPYDKISVADNNYGSPVLFYKYHYKQYNQEITITNADLLKPQEIVIAGNDSIKKYITEHYQTEQLETFKNATIYKIK